MVTSRANPPFGLLRGLRSLKLAGVFLFGAFLEEAMGFKRSDFGAVGKLATCD